MPEGSAQVHFLRKASSRLDSSSSRRRERDDGGLSPRARHGAIRTAALVRSSPVREIRATTKHGRRASLKGRLAPELRLCGSLESRP